MMTICTKKFNAIMECEDEIIMFAVYVVQHQLGGELERKLSLT